MDFDNLKKISDEEIRKIEIDLLIEVTEFLNKNDLKYTIDSGTLIGAIRHGGFIPWDDDIDIAMPYPDFLKLIEIFDNNDGLYKGELKTGAKAGFYYAKYSDKRTVVKTKHRADDLLYGIWVDIFPMYSIDNDDSRAMEDINKVLHYERKSWRVMGYKQYENPIKRIYHRIFNRPLLKFYYNQIYKIVNKYPYGSTDRIRTVPAVSTKLAYDNNLHFDDRIQMNFENHEFYAPYNYDAYLRNQYENYMELPPVEKRRTHKIDAFWR